MIIRVHLFAVLLISISAIHLGYQHASTPQPTLFNVTSATYKIQSKAGGYLEYCNNCSKSPQPEVFVSSPTQNYNQTVWTITNIGPAIKIQANNNDEYLFLSDCEDKKKCQGKVYTEESDGKNDEDLLWLPEFYNDKGWAFKSTTGKYLEKLNGKDKVVAISSVLDMTQNGFFWIFENGIKAGNVTLMAFDRGYLKICNHCGDGDYNDSVTISSLRDDLGTRFWQLQIISQSKVAFKGTNGLYLAICQNCWQHGSLYENDAIFVYVTDASAEPKAQWSPVLLDKGRWAFIGSNGLCLSRCVYCSLGVTKSLFAYAFIDISNSNAHWVIQYY